MSRSERPQNRKRNHPRPPLLETTRVDGVKAPRHRGTPRSCKNSQLSPFMHKPRSQWRQTTVRYFSASFWWDMPAGAETAALSMASRRAFSDWWCPVILMGGRMSAINGSKSKTNSSKSSTEGGPAPQRFDVAAMVVLCACGTAEAVAGAGERGKCAGLCAAAASAASVRALARRRSLARSRAAASECRCFGCEPAAAALAQQSCRVAEAEHRNDSCAATGSDGSCMRLYKRSTSNPTTLNPFFKPIYFASFSGLVFADDASPGLAESAGYAISIGFEAAKRVFGAPAKPQPRGVLRCCACESKNGFII